MAFIKFIDKCGRFSLQAVKIEKSSYLFIVVAQIVWSNNPFLFHHAAYISERNQFVYYYPF